MKTLSQKYWDIECADFSTLSYPAKISFYEINTNTRKSWKSFIRKIIPFKSFILYIKNIIHSTHSINTILRRQSDADLVIIGGGNILMDVGFFPSYVCKVYCILKAAKKYRKKTALIFAGAGPLKNKFQEWYVNKALELCDFVSVRDVYSQELLKHISPKKEIEKWYDPVMSLEGKISPVSSAIGFCVFFGTNKKNHPQVKKAYATLINKLKNHRIILFASEMADYEHVIELSKELNNSSIEVKSIRSDSDLLDIYLEIDVLVSARMHGMITAFTQRIPVIGLSWQKKFNGLATWMDMENRIFDIETMHLNIDSILNEIYSIMLNLDKETKQLDKKMNYISQEIINNFNKFAERF